MGVTVRTITKATALMTWVPKPTKAKVVLPKVVKMPLAKVMAKVKATVAKARTLQEMVRLARVTLKLAIKEDAEERLHPVTFPVTNNDMCTVLNCFVRICRSRQG